MNNNVFYFNGAKIMRDELVLINEKIPGVVKLDYQIVNKTIGTLNNNIASIKLSINNTFSSRALKALLEIHAIPSNPKYARWKTWFNSFPLTKEYKANYSITTKDEQHDIFVFDVTPIINRDIKRKTHKFVIKNIGSAEIYIGYVFLTVQLEAEKAETHHYYRILMSKCNYESPCSPLLPECTSHTKNQTIINAYYQDPPVEVSLTSGTWKRKDLFPTRAIDMVINECVGNRVIITPNSYDDVYLFSVHSYVANYDRPLIDIQTTSNQKEKNLEIELVVSNKGQIEAKDLMIIGMLYGNTVYFKKLESLKPGDSFMDKIFIEKPRNSTTMAIRAVWSEYGETIFKETKVNIT